MIYRTFVIYKSHLLFINRTFVIYKSRFGLRSILLHRGNEIIFTAFPIQFILYLKEVPLLRGQPLRPLFKVPRVAP